MAVIASLVAAVACGVCSRRLTVRWRRGRTRPAMLAWAVALAMLAIAAVALAVGAASTFNEPVFRLFVLFGLVVSAVWFALGSVLATSGDRSTLRLTGAAALGVGLVFLPGALRGEPLAVPGAILGITWALLLLDGDATRVRVGSSLLVVGWTLLATSLVLPAPYVEDLPPTGLPDVGEVLPAFVQGFARGGRAVATVVVVAGALAAIARLVRHPAGADRPEPQAGSRIDRGGGHGAARAPGHGGSWAVREGLTRVGVSRLVVGHLLVAAGVALVVAATTWQVPAGTMAGAAVGIGFGAVVVSLGVDRVDGSPGAPAAGVAGPGSTAIP